DRAHEVRGQRSVDRTVHLGHQDRGRVLGARGARKYAQQRAEQQERGDAAHGRAPSYPRRRAILWAPMQAPLRHRPRSDEPTQPPDETVRVPELRPRRVIAPLIPFVLIVVMAGFAAVLALALLPIFGAAGAGVNAFRERLDAAGVGRAGIPHLPQSSTIYAADGTVLDEIYL